MKEIVINSCYGGFSVSPEAALWLYENGMKEIATPIGEYFDDERDSGILSKKEKLKEWKKYLNNKENDSLFITVFSSDERFVLDVRPDNREHPLLIKCIKELKEKANGACAELKIVEIPDDVEYEIDEYDGIETVCEKRRKWN